MKFHPLYIIISVISALLIIGCNSEEPVCPDTQSYDFKLGLTKVSDTVSNELKIYNPEVGSFSTNEPLPFYVSIPVNITSDSTVFYIDFMYVRNDTVFIKKTDTIAFTYVSDVYLNNQECGFVMTFDIKNIYVSKHHIDSVTWLNNKIDEDNERNLEIYY